MQKTLTLATVLAAIVLIASQPTNAQTSPPPPTPPVHHGFLHNLFHRPKPGQTVTTSPMTHGHFMKSRHTLTPGATPMPDQHPLAGRTMGRHTLGRHTMSSPLMSGSIIGNKNTHVYHLPGSKGAMPAEQNRVYFRTAAEAEAAGFHAARTGGKSPRTP